jgi:spermidine synthase
VIPWQELGRAKVPGGDLVLSQRGAEFALRLRGAELMNSRAHQSEDQLAVLGCAGLATTPGVQVLIGGLGMGFTARAALDALAPDARVLISELVPEVVEWNRGPLSPLAGAPLADPRTEVVVGDVSRVIAGARARFHAILLDVDNGPDAFTAPGNTSLYGAPGLTRARHALIPGGCLGVWSVEDDRAFTGRMHGVGFRVEQHKIAPHPGSGARHVLWIGRTPSS